MSKYIIEIAEEYEEYFKGVLICGIADGKFAVDVIAREDLEELNSDYINEHYGSLQDEAYQRGHDDGYEAGCATAFKPVSGAEYQRGYEDGKKSIDLGCKDCKYNEDTSLTNPCSECTRAWKDHYTPAPYSDRIEVGDEVATETGKKYAVVSFGAGGTVCGFNMDGKWTGWNPKEVTKTGKHYDIQSILEAMRK